MATRSFGPPQSGVHAQVLRFRVVLDEARQDCIRAQRESGLELPQSLDEVAFMEMAGVVRRGKTELQTRPLVKSISDSPFQIVLPLGQVAVVEAAEPRRRASLQGSVRAGLSFNAPTG